MKLLTPSQVAKLFDVTTVTVWRWANSGRLKAIRTPSGYNRFTVTEVNRALKAAGLPLLNPNDYE